MSKKVVDERVLEMRFDNQQFEANVKTTMSTLDKLKAKLDFKGAEKGLENINAAADKCDVSHMSSAIETIQLKFSALEVTAMAALANIANSAVNAGKRLIASLSTDNISAGWEKFGSKTTSVATLVAQGYGIDTVSAQLERLNWFTDETSYNFTEMVANIAKFTATGKGLEESVTAMEGIANWAALSGQNANTASHAMYQLSQAMGAGVMRLEDYRSIQNASMDTDEFRQKCLDAAVALGTLKKNSDGTYKSLMAKSDAFNKSQFATSLTQGAWLTSDVMMKVFNDYSAAVDQIYEYSEQKGITASEAIEELGNQVDEFGLKAFRAAQEARTWGDVIDSVKDAVSTGWMNTFEIIFGDYEEQKVIWTNMANELYDVFAEPINERNEMLEGAMATRWEVFSDAITDTGLSMEDFQDKVVETGRSYGVIIDKMLEDGKSFGELVKDGSIPVHILQEALDRIAGSFGDVSDMTDELGKKFVDFEDVVNRVFEGEFGNGADRVKALTDAGYDYAQVQDLVNKVARGEKVDFEALSEAQAENTGYTKEQIEAIKELAAQAKEAGTPVNELINSLRKESGRQLLMDSAANVLKSLQTILYSVRDAWNETFNIDSTELYNAIETLHSFTEHLKISDETAEKLTRTFKGVFSIFSIIRTIVGGGIRSAFQVLSSLLGKTNFHFLDLTASIGDSISAFDEWLKENDYVGKGFNLLASGITFVIRKVKDFISAARSVPAVQSAISGVQQFFYDLFQKIGTNFQEGMKAFAEFTDRLKQLDSINLDNIGAVIDDFVTNVLGKFFDFDDVVQEAQNGFSDFTTSVSTTFEEVGKKVSRAKEVISGFFEKIGEYLGDGSFWGRILSIGVGAIMIKVILDISKALKGLANVFKHTFGFLEMVGKNIDGLLKGLGNVLNAFATKIKSEALLNVAISIGIMAAALFALCQIDDLGKLWSAVGALSVLAVVLVAVSAALSHLSKISSIGASASLLGLSVSLLLLIGALKAMEGLDGNLLLRNLAILGSMAAVMVLLVQNLSKDGNKVSGGALTFVGIAASLWIMVHALQDLDGMEIKHMGKTIVLLAAAVGSIMLIAKTAGKISFKDSLSILAIVTGLRLFVSVFEKIMDLDANRIVDNLGSFALVFAALALLFKMSHMGNTDFSKSGAGILSMSAALLVVVAAMKMISGMEVSEILKGLAVVSALMLVFAAVIMLTDKASANSMKAGVMILAMSGAILLLTGAVLILSQLPLGGLAKAVGAITVIGLMFGAVIALTGKAQSCMPTLVAITVAISMLSVMLAALSFIDAKSLLSASLALTSLIGMFAILVASTKYAKTSAGALATIGVMTLVVVALGGILYLLAGLPVESTLSMAASLSVLLLALSGACAILGAVGNTGSAAFVGIGALVTLIAAVGGIMAGLGALVTYVPQMKTFLNEGLVVLEQIGYGLGSFFGNIVGGFASGVTSGLPKIGENLSGFMDNAAGFISGAKGIDPTAMDAVGSLAGAIVAITGAEVVDAIASFFGIKTDYEEFGEKLSAFGKALGSYADSVEDLNTEAINNSLPAAESLVELANTIPNTGGLIAYIVGNNDLSTFGEGLASFGDSLVDYANSVEDLNADAIKKSVPAAESLVELAEKVPNTGGLIAYIVGNNDLSTFGEGFAAFGKSLVDYGEAVADLDTESISNSVSAASSLVDLAEKIPNTGGLLAYLSGDNDFVTFGTQLSSFGDALVGYSESVVDLQIDPIMNSIEAVNALVELANTLPNTTSLLDYLVGGQMDLGVFGTSLSSFGSCLKSYSDSVAEISLDNINNATSAVAAIVRMYNLMPTETGLIESVGNAFGGGNKMSLTTFGTQMTSFAGYLSTFNEKLADLDADQLDLAVATMNQLVAMAQSLSGVDTESMTSFGVALNALAATNVKGFLSAFSEAGPETVEAASTLITNLINGISLKSQLFVDECVKFLDNAITQIKKKNLDFYNAGSGLVTKLVDGAKSKDSSVSTTFVAIVSAAATSIRNKYTDFYNAGGYLVDGLANGISANSYKAEAKASAMASAAASAARRALDEHSPSKVGYQIGDYFGMPFVDAIASYIDKAYDTGSTLGSAAKAGLTESVSKIASFVEGNLDAQPTIRPVLDLSSVESDAVRLNSLLSQDHAYAIQNGFNRRALAAQEAEESSSSQQAPTSSWQFVQNNYSPKALSRLEIYRQTKNMFSSFKNQNSDSKGLVKA